MKGKENERSWSPLDVLTYRAVEVQDVSEHEGWIDDVEFMNYMKRRNQLTYGNQCSEDNDRKDIHEAVFDDL